MAATIHSHHVRTWRSEVTDKIDEKIEHSLPRRCTVFAIGLILAGLSIPLLMAVHVLPATFGLAFTGYALALTGAVFGLFRCGEL